MDMYICLNGNNYLVPNSVIQKYKERLSQYFKDENYLDVDKMKNISSGDFLNAFYHDCVNAVGVYTLGLDDMYLEGYNSLKNELKELDELLDRLQSRDNKNLLYEKLVDGLEVILEFYKNMLSQEKNDTKSR